VRQRRKHISPGPRRCHPETTSKARFATLIKNDTKAAVALSPAAVMLSGVAVMLSGVAVMLSGVAVMLSGVEARTAG